LGIVIPGAGRLRELCVASLTVTGDLDGGYAGEQGMRAELSAVDDKILTQFSRRCISPPTQ
jgi:uncharacterized protein YcfJ